MPFLVKLCSVFWGIWEGVGKGVCINALLMWRFRRLEPSHRHNWLYSIQYVWWRQLIFMYSSFVHWSYVTALRHENVVRFMWTAWLMPATGNKNIVGLNSILYTANKNLSVYGHWVLKRRQNFASGICCLFFFLFFCMPHFCFIFHSFVWSFPSIRFIQMCCQVYQNLQELNNNTVNCQRRDDQNCVITRKVHAGECNSLLTTRKSTTAAQAQRQWQGRQSCYKTDKSVISISVG